MSSPLTVFTALDVCLVAHLSMKRVSVVWLAPMGYGELQKFRQHPLFRSLVMVLSVARIFRIANPSHSKPKVKQSIITLCAHQSRRRALPTRANKLTHDKQQLVSSTYSWLLVAHAKHKASYRTFVL